MLSRNQCPYDECGLYYANMYDLIYHIESDHIKEPNEIEKLDTEKLEHENGNHTDSQREGSENSPGSNITHETYMAQPRQQAQTAPIPLSLLCRLQPYPKGKIVTPIKPVPRTVSFNYYRKREISPPQTPREISPKRPTIRTVPRVDEHGHIVHSSTGEIPEDHRKFRCTYEGCKKGYKNLQGLKNHMRTSHQAPGDGLNEREQGILSRIPLPDPASLAASTIRTTKFQCQHCPKSYKTMANLTKHVQDSHPRFAPTTNLQTPLITMSPIRPQSPMTPHANISESSTPQMTIVTKQLPHGVMQSPSRHVTTAHPTSTIAQFQQQQQTPRAASPMSSQPQQQQYQQQQVVHQQVLQAPQHQQPATPSRAYQTSTTQQHVQHQQQYQPPTTTQYIQQQTYSSQNQQQQQQQPTATYAQVQAYPQHTYAIQTAPQQTVQYQAVPASSQQQSTTTVQPYVAQPRQQAQIVHHRVQQIQQQEPAQQQQPPQPQQQVQQPISITQMRQSPQQQRQYVAGTGTTSVRVTTLSPFSAQQQTSTGSMQQHNPTIAQQLQAAQNQIQQQNQPQQQPQTYQYQQTPPNIPRGTTQMHVRYATQAVSQPSTLQPQQYTTGPTTHTIQIASIGTTGSSTQNTYTHTQFVRSAATGGTIQLQTVSAAPQTQGTTPGQPQMRMVPASGGNYRRVGAHLSGYQQTIGTAQAPQGQSVPRGALQTTRFYTNNAVYQQPQRSVRLTSIGTLQQQQQQPSQPAQITQHPTVNSIQLRQQQQTTNIPPSNLNQQR